MAVYEELGEIDGPSEFIVEYPDGSRERLLRGDGVGIVPPGDDPDGIGYLSADLPRKHPRNRQFGRAVFFNEMRALYKLDGETLWPID